jgi:hypothetical protein
VIKPFIAMAMEIMPVVMERSRIDFIMHF